MSHPFIGMPEVGEDYRWAGPTATCLCGSNLFYVLTMFDPHERLPGAYVLDSQCAECGALVTAPTPIDGLPPVACEGDLIEPGLNAVLDLRCPTCGLDDHVVIDYDDGETLIATCQSYQCGTRFAPPSDL